LHAFIDFQLGTKHEIKESGCFEVVYVLQKKRDATYKADTSVRMVANDADHTQKKKEDP
jgi:hypothetical protein